MLCYLYPPTPRSTKISFLLTLPKQSRFRGQTNIDAARFGSKISVICLRNCIFVVIWQKRCRKSKQQMSRMQKNQQKRQTINIAVHTGIPGKKVQVKVYIGDHVCLVLYKFCTFLVLFARLSLGRYRYILVDPRGPL